MHPLIPPYTTHPLFGPFGIGAIACAMFCALLITIGRRDRAPGMVLVGLSAGLAAIFCAAEAAGRVQAPGPLFGPLWVALMFEAMAVLRATGIARHLDPLRWQRSPALWVAVLPQLALAATGLAGVPVPRPVGNVVLGWAGFVMGLSVLHASRRLASPGHALLGAVMLLHPVLLFTMPVVGIDLRYARYVLLPVLITFYLLLIMLLLEQRRRTLAQEVAQRGAAEAALARLHTTLEGRVAERVADLEHMRAALESFNRSVSHDLRGPLTGIEAMARSARRAFDERRDDDAERKLAQIERQAHHADELLGALRELTRVGHAPLRRQPVALGTLAAEALDGLRAQAPAGQPLPPVEIGPLPLVEGDPALLRAVLVNLLGNACKFSAGRPAPRVRVEGEVAAGEARLRVRDNGPGFDAAAAARLFEPFHREHAGFDGHGIGLSIVRRVAERHGGRAWARPLEGGGAEFGVALPAAPAHAG